VCASVFTREKKKVFGEKVGVKEKLRAGRYNIFRRFNFQTRENKIRGTWGQN